MMSSAFLVDTRSLLKQLINDHPDSYVKIGDEYVPASSKLFDLEFVRQIQVIMQSEKFSTEKYKDLPVIFSCDEEERDAFDFLLDQLIYGLEYKSKMDKTLLETYIGLVARLASTEKLTKITI